jgi:hypothetical protein
LPLFKAYARQFIPAMTLRRKENEPFGQKFVFTGTGMAMQADLFAAKGQKGVA